VGPLTVCYCRFLLECRAPDPHDIAPGRDTQEQELAAWPGPRRNALTTLLIGSFMPESGTGVPFSNHTGIMTLELGLAVGPPGPPVLRRSHPFGWLAGSTGPGRCVSAGAALRGPCPALCPRLLLSLIEAVGYTGVEPAADRTANQMLELATCYRSYRKAIASLI
jgi:hypothetical protein